MKISVSLCFLVAAVSCAPQVGAPLQGSVAGIVVKGPVRSAVVRAYSVTASGRRDALVGESASDATGAFQIGIGGHAGPMLVCATEGDFVDEATGLVIGLSTNELCALVDDVALGANVSGVLLTPFSSLHAALTGCFVEDGREETVGAGSQRTALRLNDFLAAGTDGFDFRATAPFDVTAAAAPALTPEVWHGLLLAGLSESAVQISLQSDLDPGVRITPATLATELVRDIDDGRCLLDGRGPAGSLSQGTIALSANTLRGAPQGLAQSIGAFLEGERNRSGVSRASVEDLLSALSTHDSEIFGGAPGGDLEAPVLTIVEPAAGPVAGTPRIVVSASDASAVTELVFVAPASLVGSGTIVCEQPVVCTLEGVLNTALLPPGDVTLSVRATDEAGNSSTASVVVVVNNSIPVITLDSPGAGTVSGLVGIRAQASDPDGLASFVVDVPGTVLASQCAPPLQTSDCDRELDPAILDIQWDTTQAPEGALSITFTATDAAGNAAFRQVAVVVDNVDAGTVAGRVDFGAPVVGANVTAFQMSDGIRGAVIGTATTDDEGRYAIENASFAGAIEVSAIGGTFIDPSTGLTLSLRSGQALVAAVAGVELGVAFTVNVNGWTTLAAHRAEAMQAESASFGAAAMFNAALFASHLLRPGALSLTESGSSDLLVESPAPSDAAAVMALAHAGLSRMAAQLSIDVGGAPGQITPVDLVDVLSLDGSDGVFDGADHGAVLFLDGQSVPSDSSVLRTGLAVAIDAFVKNAPFRSDGVVVLDAVRNNSGIASTALAAPDLLYDDLSLDRSVLFSANEPVVPFDRSPPMVSFSFGAPNEGRSFGDALSGVVSILAVASDPSGLSAFPVLGPGVPDLFSPLADVRVELDGQVAPNAADVLALCGIDVSEPLFALADVERQVCLCVEAVDALENATDAVWCFTRPRPVVTTDAGAFIGPARAVVHAQAVGSFELEECAAELKQPSGGVAHAVGVGTDNVCSLVVPLAGLVTGEATLQVDVTEIGGAVSRSSFVTTVDLDAPSVSIAEPAAGAFRAVPPVLVAVASDAHLASVTADVTSNALPVASGLVGIVGADGTITFPPYEDAEPDGLRTILVTATDAAGNATTEERSYTKDTTAPVLSNVTAADGGPLRHFQLTATTAFVPSLQCLSFPFAGCVFNIPASTASESVDLRPGPNAVETYRRWQHLVPVLVNPSAGATAGPENRAPTLRLHTEPGITVEARIDMTCPADEAFDDRARGAFVSSTVGLVDVPIVDGLGLTTTSLLRTQLGEQTLCLSMRPRDEAGNTGAVLHHFFRYESTPAPLFFLFNPAPSSAGGYDPALFAEDVEAFDDGHDDKVLNGSGQGAAGRVIAHAYLVSPSTSTTYRYHYALDAGPAPQLLVRHREVVQIAKNRAFNWCNTLDGSDAGTSIDDGDDDLTNPDRVVANVTGSAPNNPTWSGSTIDERSSSPSWALFRPTGGTLLSAIAVMEHRDPIAGESDTTFSHDPAVSYPTDEDTTVLGQLGTFTVELPDITLEVWSVNATTGMPTSVLDAGTTVSFSAGGSSAASRHRLLLFRAPVPTNALTLKTAQVLNGQAGTLGFNDLCSARSASGDLVSQMFALPSAHFVVTDADIPGSSAEPAEARRVFWVKSGAFSLCDGAAAHDCRYGRYFEDYVTSTLAFAAARGLGAQGKLDAPSALLKAQASAAVPAGQMRDLSQEP